MCLKPFSFSFTFLDTVCLNQADINLSAITLYLNLCKHTGNIHFCISFGYSHYTCASDLTPLTRMCVNTKLPEMFFNEACCHSHTFFLDKDSFLILTVLTIVSNFIWCGVCLNELTVVERERKVCIGYFYERLSWPMVEVYIDTSPKMEVVCQIRFSDRLISYHIQCECYHWRESNTSHEVCLKKGKTRSEKKLAHILMTSDWFPCKNSRFFIRIWKKIAFEYNMSSNMYTGAQGWLITE